MTYLPQVSGPVVVSIVETGDAIHLLVPRKLLADLAGQAPHAMATAQARLASYPVVLNVSESGRAVQWVVPRQLASLLAMPMTAK